MAIDPRILKRSLPLGVLAAALLTACATPRAMPTEDDGLEPGGIVITREQIETSGAHNAFEAIERAVTHLQIQRTGQGKRARVTHRGRDSFMLSPQVLVVIDGTRVATVEGHLRNIPAASIAFIQILSDREATTKFGSEAGNGVILVRTTAQ